MGLLSDLAKELGDTSIGKRAKEVFGDNSCCDEDEEQAGKSV
jgi:hypothetical protein